MFFEVAATMSGTADRLKIDVSSSGHTCNRPWPRKLKVYVKLFIVDLLRLELVEGETFGREQCGNPQQLFLYRSRPREASGGQPISQYTQTPNATSQQTSTSNQQSTLHQSSTCNQLPTSHQTSTNTAPVSSNTKQRDMLISYVEVVGVILAIITKDSYYLLDIDDGTGVIGCFYYKPECSDLTRDSIRRINTRGAPGANDPLAEVMREVSGKVATQLSLARGQLVVITGALNRYKPPGDAGSAPPRRVEIRVHRLSVVSDDDNYECNAIRHRLTLYQRFYDA